MNKLILTIVSLLTYVAANAQYAYFATRGTIAYDKISYTKARMRDMQQQISQNNSNRMGMGGRMFDIENIEESSTEKYILEFDENSTLLYIDPKAQTNETSPKGQNQIRANGGGRGQIRVDLSSASVAPAGGSNKGAAGPRARPNNNSKIIYQNIKTQTAEVQIEIDDKYIITDTLNQITWRFSEEYRNIAGYECRRVNGSTKDSLYLIAFYTDEIPLAAGPALTYGLPGMILGLVIPEMHLQYWATKVDFTNEVVRKDWKDKKSKVVPIDDFVSSFGRFFQRGRDISSSKRQVQEQLIY